MERVRKVGESMDKDRKAVAIVALHRLISVKIQRQDFDWLHTARGNSSPLCHGVAELPLECVLEDRSKYTV